eukprot:907028-Pleurochrysis_carterae.AAC.2
MSVCFDRLQKRFLSTDGLSAESDMPDLAQLPRSALISSDFLLSPPMVVWGASREASRVCLRVDLGRRLPDRLRFWAGIETPKAAVAVTECVSVSEVI